MASGPERLIRVGVIARAHGIRGEVFFRPDEPGSQTLLKQRSALVRDRQGVQRERALASARTADQGLLLRLEGVGDRTAAEQLAGAVVFLPRSALEAPAHGEFFVADLLGLEARSLSGAVLGRVERVVGPDEVPVLEIEGASTIQVPLVDTFVKRIDVEAGFIEVEPPQEEP